jgi:hypothetical protein
MRRVTMKKLTAVIVAVLASGPVFANDLVFGFNSPAFNGNGYSTHVLTIHQLEQQRKDKIVADEQAEIDRAERDYRNTNAYKFQNNLESRIYAQLSRQIADALFGEGGTTIVGEWAEAATPFGDNIRWMRDIDDRIYVEVYNSNGELTSSFDVPVGEFAF